MLTWLKTAWEGLKSMFGGKGTVQIGKTNETVSNVSLGDNATGVTVANTINNNNHYYPSPVTEKSEFEPTQAEIEILLRLDNFPDGYLNLVHFDGGVEVLIGNQQLGGLTGGTATTELHEAVQNLLSHGFLTDIKRDGEIFHLSASGRVAANRLRVGLSRATPPDFSEVERLMPQLLQEMKEDFSQAPVLRELVLLPSDQVHFPWGGVAKYYRDKHPQLDSLFQILENHQLVENVSKNNILRYRISEPFARYLTAG